MSVLGVAQLGSTLVTEISDFRGLTTCLTTYKKYRFSPFPGVAQLGSALGSGPRGRWFESSHSDHKKEPPTCVGGSFLRVGVIGKRSAVSLFGFACEMTAFSRQENGSRACAFPLSSNPVTPTISQPHD